MTVLETIAIETLSSKLRQVRNTLQNRLEGTLPQAVKADLDDSLKRVLDSLEICTLLIKGCTAP